MGGCVGLLEKESYNRWALIGVSAFLIAESAVLIPLSMAESNESGSFACYDSGEKKTFDIDGLRERCYEQYDQLNNTRFPLCALGWLEFLLMLFLSIVYSVRIAPRVYELKQARSRPVSPKWKLFTVYVGHLLIRFALVTLFLILQWTIYPVSFPAETFSCSETLNNSTNSSANGNTMVTTYRYCENHQAKVKSICGYMSCSPRMHCYGYFLVSWYICDTNIFPTSISPRTKRFIRSILPGWGVNPHNATKRTEQS